MFELAFQGANIASVPLCPRLSLKAARVDLDPVETTETQRIAAFEPVAVRFLTFAPVFRCTCAPRDRR